MSATTPDPTITEITPDSEFWPAGLRDLPGFGMRNAMPERLWVRGSLGALQRPAIGIIGARNATAYGEHITRTFAEDIVREEFAVVSGLAYGIDAAAHRAAMAVGGITVAYVAQGVDRVYPAGHHDLADRIISSGGAVISEYPLTSPPNKVRFLQRNRLIAAHGRQLVVPEAGDRSGSLNTTSHASRLGRPIWAAPGPLTSPASAGCHRIISEGRARILTSIADLALQNAEGKA